MKLVEVSMLLEAAEAQVDSMEPGGQGVLHEQYESLREKVDAYTATDEDMASLRALASPRLMTVSFNAW